MNWGTSRSQQLNPRTEGELTGTHKQGFIHQSGNATRSTGLANQTRQGTLPTLCIDTYLRNGDFLPTRTGPDRWEICSVTESAISRLCQGQATTFTLELGVNVIHHKHRESLFLFLHLNRRPYRSFRHAYEDGQEATTTWRLSDDEFCMHKQVKPTIEVNPFIRFLGSRPGLHSQRGIRQHMRSLIVGCYFYTSWLSDICHCAVKCSLQDSPHVRCFVSVNSPSNQDCGDLPSITREGKMGSSSQKLHCLRIR